MNDKNNTMQVDLAVKGAAVQIQGSTSVELRGREYTAKKLSVINDLLWNVILDLTKVMIYLLTSCNTEVRTAYSHYYYYYSAEYYIYYR